MTSFGVETVHMDLPAAVGAFGRRLHEAGVPVSAERSARFASALSLISPVARRRLYWTARAVFVSDPSQLRAFDAVFASVFGTSEAADVTDVAVPDDARQVPSESPDELPAADLPLTLSSGKSSATAPGPRGRADPATAPILVPTIASDDEVLRGKRFDALSAQELGELYRLMSELELATPRRRTRRAESFRHGERIDPRRTLRWGLRTGGDPVRFARRRRRVVPRRLVLLCDISGSMEPYARAYLQFLTCAVGTGSRQTRRTEAFVFATRLTRLTHALQSRNPERAMQQAAATAPDWSSGTRIGDALKTFNDRHGRRGMARGAVVVILSDGWERGNPSLVAREMQRLSRLAYRIVWVNPRAGARDFSVQAGGMAAALPHCDAFVSGHSVDSLHEVVAAIGAPRSRELALEASWRAPAVVEPAEAAPEPWPSATPVPGSSVAMPSGYGPSRGKTTPGWSIG